MRTERGSSHDKLVEIRRGEAHSHAGHLATVPRRRSAPLQDSASASSRRPSLPSRHRCTVAASAQSAWFVQMFDVAFSRRMCCSRVASVRHESAASGGVCGLPGQPARHLPHEFFPRCDHSGVWPADSSAPFRSSASPSPRCPPRPAGAPRRATRPPDRHDDQQRLPRVGDPGELWRLGSIAPKKFGDCTTTAAVSSFTAAASALASIWPDSV